MSNRDDAYMLQYFNSCSDALRLVSKNELSKVIKVLLGAWKKRRQVFIIGNGGSASTATHFAADLAKTIVEIPGQKGIKAISLVDNIPLASALINDWGKESLFEEQLRTYFCPGDILVAFSVHGGSGNDKDGLWSQNLIRAIKFVKDNGGTAIGFSGFDGGAMKTLCDVCVVVSANSTPVVESLHVVLAHLITFRIKELAAKKNA